MDADASMGPHAQERISELSDSKLSDSIESGARSAVNKLAQCRSVSEVESHKLAGGSDMRIAIAAILAVSLAACNGEKSSQAPEPAAVPEVGVMTLTSRHLPLTKILPGRITPIRIAEVRPRISGIILERTFQQGSVVSAGTILYRIDPVPFQVELDAAQAALAKAEAALVQASRQEDRIRSLLAGNTATQAQYDLALATERQAEAEVAAQKAAVARAQVNLDYTNVRAPISGRIGRALVTEGALISPIVHLATIQQLDPIYADFTQSVSELKQLKRDLDEGRLRAIAPGEASVRLLFEDGSAYAHSGRLLFSDISVDPGTAQVTLRGEFPNPEAELLPGTYVRIEIQEAIDVDATTVPAQAIRRTTAGGSAVFVVNDEGRAILQPVHAGRTLGTSILIDGLSPGVRVVVDGFQKFTPGSLVKAVPVPDIDATNRAGSN